MRRAADGPAVWQAALSTGLPETRGPSTSQERRVRAVPIRLPPGLPMASNLFQQRAAVQPRALATRSVCTRRMYVGFLRAFFAKPSSEQAKGSDATTQQRSPGTVRSLRGRVRFLSDQVPSKRKICLLTALLTFKLVSPRAGKVLKIDDCGHLRVSYSKTSWECFLTVAEISVNVREPVCTTQPHPHESTGYTTHL